MGLNGTPSVAPPWAHKGWSWTSAVPMVALSVPSSAPLRGVYTTAQRLFVAFLFPALLKALQFHPHWINVLLLIFSPIMIIILIIIIVITIINDNNNNHYYDDDLVILPGIWRRAKSWAGRGRSTWGQWWNTWGQSQWCRPPRSGQRSPHCSDWAWQT